MKRTPRKYEFHVTDEHKDADPSTLGYGTVYEGFADKTTAHGISHVHVSKGIVKKVYWMFFSLVSVATFLYYGETLVVKFFSWPVMVRVNIQNKPELVFPAVTVCNMNPVMKFAVLKDPYILNMLGIKIPSFKNNNNNNDDPDDMTTEDSPNDMVTSTLDSTTMGQLPPPRGRKKRQLKQQDGETEKPKNKRGKPRRGNFELEMKLEQYIAELDVEAKMTMGHPIEEFILDCEYSGYDCSISDFYQFYNSKYGNCFVFNSGWNTSDNTELEVSRRPGPQYGLKLILNIDQAQYVGKFADSAGVHITVHPQEAMPFPEDEGITIQPGAVTFVGLRKETIHRLGRPHGNCTEEVDEYKNVYQEIFPVNYTMQACLKTCIQISNFGECGCGNSFYPLSGKAFGDTKMRTCDLTNTNDSDCVDSVMNKYKTGELDCDCAMSCHETVYTSTISTGNWPSEAYRGELFQTLAASNRKARLIINNKREPDKYKNNFAKVNLFFEEFNLNNVTEHAEYTAGQFVSDIGGILGLFIGFSVLTIMEFAELIMDCVALWCMKSKAKNKTHDFNGNNETVKKDTRNSGRQTSVSPPPPYCDSGYAMDEEGSKKSKIVDQMYIQDF